MNSVPFPEAHVPVLDEAARKLTDAPNGTATFVGEARGYEVTTVTDKADPAYWTITVTVKSPDGPQEVVFLRIDHGKQAYRCSLTDAEWSQMLAWAIHNSVRHAPVAETAAVAGRSAGASRAA